MLGHDLLFPRARIVVKITRDGRSEDAIANHHTGPHHHYEQQSLLQEWGVLKEPLGFRLLSFAVKSESSIRGMASVLLTCILSYICVLTKQRIHSKSPPCHTYHGNKSDHLEFSWAYLGNESPENRRPSGLQIYFMVEQFVSLAFSSFSISQRECTKRQIFSD